MIESKPWFLSRTIWAAVVSTVAAAGAFFGVPVDEAAKAGLTDGILQLVSVVAGLFTILGRLTASTRIA